ncbi:MAG: hypothetical protein Q4A27_03440 [bacterium]|nr:hypothetical protein [bacterium]
MENVALFEKVIYKIEEALKKGDLGDVTKILAQMSWEEKTEFTAYCRELDIKHCDYGNAINLLPEANFESFVESVYSFPRNDSPGGANRVVEARIELMSKVLFWDLVTKKLMFEPEAYELSSIQELRMRIDLMNHNKAGWQNSVNLKSCWEIVNTLQHLRPEEDMLEDLVELTIDFVSADRSGYRMRALEPDSTLIEYIRQKDCLNIFPSKRVKTLKRWQKIRN